MEPAAPRPQAGTRGDSPTAVGVRGSEGGSAAYGWHAIKRERETERERRAILWNTPDELDKHKRGCIAYN